MIFPAEERVGIRAGRITVTFRHWTRPKVSAGKVYDSPNLGRIKILDITTLPLGAVSAADARATGAASLFDFFERFRCRFPDCDLDTTQVTRVKFRFIGNSETRTEEKPRPAQVLALSKLLEETDRRARSGPWTFSYLKTLGLRGELFSLELSEILEESSERIKKRVSLLRKHGLVESTQEGYALTRLGEMVWKFLEDRRH